MVCALPGISYSERRRSFINFIMLAPDTDTLPRKRLRDDPQPTVPAHWLRFREILETASLHRSRRAVSEVSMCHLCFRWVTGAGVWRCPICLLASHAGCAEAMVRREDWPNTRGDPSILDFVLGDIAWPKPLEDKYWRCPFCEDALLIEYVAENKDSKAEGAEGDKDEEIYNPFSPVAQ